MSDAKLVRKVYELVSPYKWLFVLTYGVLVAELVFEQMLPKILSRLVDVAVYAPDIYAFLRIALVYGAVFCAYAACGFLQLQIWQYEHNSCIYDIRRKCCDRLFRFKASKLCNIKSGDVLRTLDSDCDEVHHFIQRYAMRIVNAGIGTVVSLVLVARVRLEIALFMALFVPISLFVSRAIEKRINASAEALRKKQGELSAWLMEVLKGKLQVKLLGADKYAYDQYSEKNKEVISAHAKQDAISFATDKIIGLVNLVCDICFYIICAVVAAKGYLTAGNYVAVSAYYSIIVFNVRKVMNGNVEYQKRKVCIERVLKILESDAETSGNAVLGEKIEKIDVDGLTFSYDGKRQILNDVSFAVKAGEVIGIAGASGEGKTTIASLFLHLFEPEAGKISINNVNILEIGYETLRKIIGVADQENIIFDGTVRYNLTLGREIDESIIWEMLKKAAIYDEINKLPDKLDTLLGNGGTMLSGGQIQRLCIARTMLREPQIVILDEATSSLDRSSKDEVMQTLWSLTYGKTVIVISHDYDVLRQTDRVIYLNNGAIEAVGAADELFEKVPSFKRLFGGE